MTKTTAVLLLGALAIAGSTTLAAPNQTYPGQPTQGRVFIENRGSQQAIPVSVHHVAGDATMKVQVVGTPSVTIAASSVLDTRRVRQTWEYQGVLVRPEVDVTVELNRFGSAGWETALQYTAPGGGMMVVFKRPRENRP
jgi:hypothetical protein